MPQRNFGLSPAHQCSCPDCDVLRAAKAMFWGGFVCGFLWALAGVTAYFVG